jgi:DNA processing protein
VPEACARDFARELAMRAPAPIVSGLAAGIDTAAHEGALAAGVQTIAYVGNGLGATYPPENADLEERIVASGGCIASELLPGEPAARWSLVRRDRLQAAQAAAVVLVQSDRAGGAMHTLRFARDLGRPCFALPPGAGAGYEGNADALLAGARALPLDAALAAEMLASGRA